MKQVFSPTQYKLQSIASGKVFNDNGWLLDAPNEKTPGLVRALYSEKQLHLLPKEFGIYQFASWLPLNRILEGSSAPLTYKSTGLSSFLGLNNLYITFSGFFPEKGIEMQTCSFKETEAYSVCGRMTDDHNQILVVASAGNTARAFAKVCSDNQIPLLITIPEDNLDVLWFKNELDPCVKVICNKGSDYFDAIHLSNIAATIDGFVNEGGAKNIARRDGMGTTVLSASTFIGEIPDYYFQAIGSSTGAIAAWEANLRLNDDGRFGNKKMKLMLSQNHPFVPIYNSWMAKSPGMLPFDDDEARHQIDQIDAKVLSNRRPPYALAGGLFDALNDTNGEIFSVTNEEAAVAGKLFLENENIDIHPAAAVAVASLMQAVKRGEIDRNKIIMLNITGGGEELFKKSQNLVSIKPSLVIDHDSTEHEIKEKVASLF